MYGESMNVRLHGHASPIRQWGTVGEDHSRTGKAISHLNLTAPARTRMGPLFAPPPSPPRALGHCQLFFVKSKVNMQKDDCIAAAAAHASDILSNDIAAALTGK